MAVLGVLVGLAVLAAFAALHWYAWRRLVRDTTAGPGPARRAGTVLFVAGPLLVLAALVAGRAGAPFPLQRIVAWPGYLWLALSLYLLLALLVGELVRPLLGWWVGRRGSGGEAAHSVEGDVGERAPSIEAAPAERGSIESVESTPAATTPSPSPPPTRAPSRRLFVSRIVGGGVAAAAVGTVGYGAYGVLRGPRVKRVTVPLAKLPRGAHGFRIAVVSDVHLGPILGRGFTQRVVDTVNATQPDLIAVVGDLVDGSVEDLGPAAAPLAGLRSRHGAYFVTGNHEYFSGAEQWVDHVRELGLRPLRNARTELPGFDLAGVDDVAGEDEGEGPDFAKALGDRDRSRASVLLAHQPVVIHDAVEHGVDLQLSGHTHGGQLWPGNLVADLANPTLAGLERYGDTQLYVSRGAGAWGPPVRVGAPSDITVVELASRQA
ncbi:MULTISPECIES: metallophosphoesterase [Streptomyces]|uniref:metallophosphoesterase n=1 Tax=Streptomyces TaxID=1883 RepID=UPI001E3CF79C|nr:MULTISPECIES: metallophosphoesterase [Streptomyces]UFQ17599.1 metallophosphoesterase [Streptomyces huasconensis]WCL87204.1 metallophosphoesterase [Streptomyces sp. JCM 35825]